MKKGCAHLVAVGLPGEDSERGLDDTSSESENQVEGGLLLDVVIRKGSSVLELLSGEDESLLVRGDTLLVLDLEVRAKRGIGERSGVVEGGD